jgi:hypothetical protein
MTYLIDFIAIFIAVVFTTHATSDSWCGVVGGALVAIYGGWCFFDGTRMGRKKGKK